VCVVPPVVVEVTIGKTGDLGETVEDELEHEEETISPFVKCVSGRVSINSITEGEGG
jgi:hypothetical protein